MNWFDILRWLSRRYRGRAPRTLRDCRVDDVMLGAAFNMAVRRSSAPPSRPASSRLSPAQSSREATESCDLSPREGMGVIYEVDQVATGARRALKVMHARFASDETLRARFVQEARLAASIPSDHVAQVLDSGRDEDPRTRALHGDGAARWRDAISRGAATWRLRLEGCPRDCRAGRARHPRRTLARHRSPQSQAGQHLFGPFSPRDALFYGQSSRFRDRQGPRLGARSHRGGTWNARVDGSGTGGRRSSNRPSRRHLEHGTRHVLVAHRKALFPECE